MKKLITIILLFLMIGCFAQSGYLGRVVPVYVGDIINVEFNAASGSEFSRTGSSGTWTYGAGGLEISGTGTNAADNHIQFTNWYTDLEKNSCELTFTPTADGNGIGVGFIGGNGRIYFARIVLTGATKGQLRFDCFDNGGNATRATSGTTYFPVTNGQQHKLTITRQPDSTFINITNTVTNATQTLGYQDVFVNSVFNSYRAGKMGIIWYGGSQTVSRFRYYTPIQKNPRILFTGDSNMQGAYAGSSANRYTQKIDSSTNERVEVVAGSGNTSGDVVNLLPEILLIRPQALFINIGTNAYNQAHIDTIVANCARNGIRVFLSTIFPTNSGVNANNTSVRATAGVTLIDFDATLLNGGSVLDPAYQADAAHLNAAGNQAVYNQLRTDLSSYLTFYP